MPTDAEKFASGLCDAIKFYLVQNKLTSLGQLNRALLEPLIARYHEHHQQITKQRKAKGEATAEEIAIYEAYPRRIARGDAIVAIRAALQNMDGAKLLAATRHFSRCVERWPANYRFKEGRDLVPHPATWFNRGSYQDDPKEWLPAGMFVRQDDMEGERGNNGPKQTAVSLAEPQGWREATQADPDYAMFSNREWSLIPDFYKQRIIKLTSTTPP